MATHPTSLDLLDRIRARLPAGSRAAFDSIEGQYLELCSLLDQSLPRARTDAHKLRSMVAELEQRLVQIERLSLRAKRSLE